MIGTTDLNIDLNKERQELNLITEDLTSICKSQKYYKELLKNKVKKDSLDIWFDNRLCEKIEVEAKPNSNVKNNLDDTFTMTNAINFDFSGTTDTSPGYFGHINYFFNTYDKDKKPTNYFINTGLMKVNYFSMELNQGTREQEDFVRLIPLDKSDKYVRMYNKYDYDIKLSSYSAYIQTLRKIGGSKNLFFQAHGEFMVSNLKTNLKITTIQSDTIQIVDKEKMLVHTTLNADQNFNTQNISVFLGVGITAKYNIRISEKSTAKYFAQLTGGMSTTRLNPNYTLDFDIETSSFLKSTKFYPFFIIHSYFNNSFENLNLIIGAQIRGNLIKPPLHSFYIGLSTSIEKLAKIF